MHQNSIIRYLVLANLFLDFKTTFFAVKNEYGIYIQVCEFNHIRI